MSTDYNISQKKIAFNNLIKNKKKKKDIEYILDKNLITIVQSSIKKCLYCDSNLLKTKITGLINSNIQCGRFCNKICRSIYYTIYKHILILNYNYKNIYMVPFFLIDNKDEYFKLLSSINYNNILKSDFIFEDTRVTLKITTIENNIIKSNIFTFKLI